MSCHSLLSHHLFLGLGNSTDNHPTNFAKNSALIYKPLTNFAFSKYSEFWISWDGENSAKIYKLILSAKLVFFANVIFFKNQIDFRTQGFFENFIERFFCAKFFRK